jgi:hypothetical protein
VPKEEPDSLGPIPTNPESFRIPSVSKVTNAQPNKKHPKIKIKTAKTPKTKKPKNWSKKDQNHPPKTQHIKTK